jgi:hypothetical protein
MDFIEWLLLGLLVGGVWLWLDSIGAREAGVKAASRTCAEEGLLFLDDTVAIRSLRLARDDEGRLRLRRVYAFEYSDNGDNRRSGSVTLLGRTVEFLHVRPQLYVVPATHENLH